MNQLFMNAWSLHHAAKGSAIRKTLSKGLISFLFLIMLTVLANFGSFAQTDPAAPNPFPTCSPCGAHRWYSGDGWRLNGTQWQAVTLSSPSLQPKGVVRCASSAETESQLQRFGCSSWNSSSLPPAFNTLIAAGPQTNYYDMNGGLNGEGGYNYSPCSSPVSSTAFNPPSAGEQIVWLNFDLRPNAGSMQFQVVTNNDVAWALFQVNPDLTLSLTGPNSSNTSSAYPTGADGTPLGLSGSCNPANLVTAKIKGQNCPLDPNIFFGRSGNGWSTIDCRSNGAGTLLKPANFYLAMWMNSPSLTRFPNNLNLVFKSRYGCGVLCVADSVSQSVKCDPNSSGKIVCAKFAGALGSFKIDDQSIVKATSYTVKYYNVNNSPLSGGFTTNYAGLTSPSSYVNFGTQNNSNDAVYAEVCATYADPNQCYKICLMPVDPSCDDTACISGCLAPPTCQANAVVTGSSPELVGPSFSALPGCGKFYTFTASVANKSFTVGGGTSYRIYFTDLTSGYTFNTSSGLFTQTADVAGIVKFEVTYVTSDGCTCRDSVCVEVKSICPAPFTLSGPRTGCKNTSIGPVCCPYGQDPGIQFDWTISGGGSLDNSPANYPQCVNVNLNNSGSAVIVTLTIKNLIWNTVCALDTHRILPNVVLAGSLSSNQVVCPGQTPATLAPSGSVCNGTPSYRWESASTCSGPWTFAFNQPTYTPPTSNAAYRLILTCTVDGVQCSDTSNCSTVTVNQFSANTISASQAICYNGTPACLTGSVVTSSCTSEGYKWIMSTTGCNGPWVNVCNTGQCSNYNAANKDYCPSALTATTYYKRVVSANCNGTKCYDTSNCVTITVINPEAGDISGTQTICKGSCASPIPSGGAAVNPGGCTITYQWQSALTCSGPWSNMSNPPSFCPLVTTSYRRITSVTCNSVTCYDTSNCIVITVIDPEAGNISGDQTICKGSCANITGNAPVNPGGCTISYQWQSATTCSGPWSNVAPPPYCPSATTSYRRIASVTCNGVTCKDTSNCVTITVNQFSTNTLTSPAAICEGDAPVDICGTSVTSTCSFVGYSWLISTAGCNGPWTAVSGGQCYSTPALSVGTYYFKRVAIANCSGTTCYDTSSNCATYVVKPVPTCSITGDPTVCSGDTICFTSTVSLGGASHFWTVTPSGPSVSATIVGSNTGSTVCVVATGGSGTYTVQDQVSVDGCSSNCSHDVIVNYCGAFCTYTQGYYGSPNGKSCDGTTRYNNPVLLIQSELANVPGDTLVIGTRSSGNYVLFPASLPSDILASATRINSVMPGGRTPRTMPAGGCNAIVGSCFSSPAYLTLQGRINNNFFSQLLALSLSANMNNRVLAGFHLESGYLVTQKRSSCSVDADPVPCSSDGGAISSRQLDQSVINYLNACGHNTVQDLIDLANYVIAGQTPGGQFAGCTAAVPSLNALHGMCGSLNEIFDECRSFVGYFSCAKNCSNINVPCTPTSVPTWDRNGSLAPATVEAFPNPYKDQVTFVIKSPVAAKGSLKVYNALGQLISTVFQGSVPAGKSKNIQFDAPVSDGSLFYIYEQNGQKVTGKLIKQ